MKDAIVRFARWLRRTYEFPVRVPVYLFPSEVIITMHGDEASASFFAPWDRTEEPFIRLATGDYPKLKKDYGRNDALAAFLHSLAHETVHYHQWISTGEVTERGVIRKATKMVDEYASTVDIP